MAKVLISDRTVIHQTSDSLLHPTESGWNSQVKIWKVEVAIVSLWDQMLCMKDRNFEEVINISFLQKSDSLCSVKV